MRLRDDERAVAIQVGAIILFAFVVIAISLWQAQVVPDQNEQVEFRHQTETTQQMIDVRGAVLTSASRGGSQSVTLTLGQTYPSRTIFVNPPPVSGTLRTVGTTDSSLNATISNAQATRSETDDFWDGSNRSYNTGGLVYSANYHELSPEPDIVYENTVVYGRYPNANVTQTGQDVIDGSTIRLVALNGSVQQSGSDASSLDVRAVSASTRTIQVQDDGSNITITLPTQLSGSEWTELLSGEPNVNSVTVSGVPGEPFNLVRIELKPGTYTLKLAKVGVGSDVTEDPEETYITTVGSETKNLQTDESETFTVEVRDEYNNPVSGRVVNVSASAGTVTPNQGTTDGDGQLSFTYEAPSTSGTYTVTANISTSPTTYEEVTYSVTVSSGGGGGGGGGGAYSIQFDDGESYNWDVSSEGDTITLTASTQPENLEGFSTDFAVNNTSVATIFSEDSETDSNGDASVRLNAQGNGTVAVYVGSSGSSDVINVTVRNVGGGGGGGAPTASFTYSCTGTTCTFDASGSSDPEGNLVEYRWDFDGDGNFEENTTSATTTFDYTGPGGPGPGTYDVTLIVEDGEGKTDSTTNQVSTGGGLVYNGDASASPGSNNGKDSVLSFSIDSTRNDQVEITRVKLNNTTLAPNDAIDGAADSENELELDVNDDGTVDGYANKTGGYSIPADMDAQSQGDTALINGGETVSLRVYQFVNKGGNAIDINDESFTITVYYSVNGESYSYTFRVTA